MKPHEVAAKPHEVAAFVWRTFRKGYGLTAVAAFGGPRPHVVGYTAGDPGRGPGTVRPFRIGGVPVYFQRCGSIPPRRPSDG